MNKPNKISLNSFYHYANECRKNLTDEDELEKIDMTTIFYAELEEHIKNGEIIIIQINGKTRLGKSTVGIAIAHDTIYQLLKKYKNKKGKFNMQNICRDQQEFTKRMRNPQLMQEILVVDESNELEKGGENSSAENSLRLDYSNVQAGRYVHTISCSPKETIDPNCDIILSVYYINKEKKNTRCKLYYKFYEGGTEYIQLLGYVEIYVGNIIRNWDETAKELFYKNEKTQEEEQTLKNLAKKDFYVEYMIKKYEKMDLINKEGIFRPRILDYANSILRVIEQLQPLTKMTQLITHNIARNYIKIAFKEDKIPTSIIGEELATREVMGVLELFKALHKLKKEHQKNENKGQKNQEIEKMIKTLQESITIQMNEYHKYVEINQKYNEVLK